MIPTNGLTVIPLLALFAGVVFTALRLRHAPRVDPAVADDEPDMGVLLDRIWSFQGGNEHEQVQRD